MFDDAEPWPESVVGWICMHCEEPVVEGESGLVIPCVRQGPPGPDGEPGRPVSNPEAVHKECHIRSIMGSVEHLEGRCGTCNGVAPDGPHRHPADMMSYRDQARAVIAWLATNRL